MAQVQRSCSVVGQNQATHRCRHIFSIVRPISTLQSLFKPATIALQAPSKHSSFTVHLLFDRSLPSLQPLFNHSSTTDFSVQAGALTALPVCPLFWSAASDNSDSGTGGSAASKGETVCCGSMVLFLSIFVCVLLWSVLFCVEVQGEGHSPLHLSSLISHLSSLISHLSSLISHLESLILSLSS
jgi:hypothetical protein